MSKEYTVQPTKKQREYVRNLSVADTQQQAMLNAGYSESTALQQERVIRTKGVQQLIAAGEAVGITDQYVVSKIKEVMDNKRDPGSIIKAIRLWINVKHPATKEGDLTLNQININNYTPDQQIEDAFYLIRASGMTKKEILNRLGM